MYVKALNIIVMRQNPSPSGFKTAQISCLARTSKDWIVSLLSDNRQ